jgi:hypothetical protein
MPEVTIDTKIVKWLIQRLADLDVESGCHITAINRVLAPDQPLRSKVLDEYEVAKPKVGDSVFLRYREIVNALESGENIPDALAKFARQEGMR